MSKLRRIDPDWHHRGEIHNMVMRMTPATAEAVKFCLDNEMIETAEVLIRQLDASQEEEVIVWGSRDGSPVEPHAIAAELEAESEELSPGVSAVGALLALSGEVVPETFDEQAESDLDAALADAYETAMSRLSER